MNAGAWFRTLLRDPVSGDVSSARVSALVSFVVGALVAAVACRVALTTPEHSSAITALTGLAGLFVGGGSFSLTRRTIAEGGDDVAL